jgi:tryptophan-rich sensory protein
MPFLGIRGGGKAVDSDLALFGRVGINAFLENAVMLGILAGTKQLADRVEIPKLSGLPLVQWFGLFVIAYASSFIGSIIEGGVSAASNQVLDPNVVPSSPEWYNGLKKPSWNPPGWLFPIMWLIVSKPTQMIAVSKILISRADKLPFPVLALYCGHLALGNAWNKVFFGMQCIGRGTAVITAFYGLLLASTYAFYQVEPSAGLFLLPTCGWVTVATALNWSIYLKNK